MGGAERDLQAQFSFKETLPCLDKKKFSDPEYLALWRQFSSWLLVKYRNDLSRLAAVKDWIVSSGVEHDGVSEGILFGEEVDWIIKEGLVYPLPWTAAKAKANIPGKYDSALGLFLDSVPNMAGQGIRVGLASGVFDIFHAGHLLFLKECLKHCQVLVVGVDSNSLVRRVKGEKHPYNDFAVRSGTLNELPEVDFICLISELAAGYIDAPYMSFFWPMESGGLVERYLNGAALDKSRGHDWYEKVGPNLVFLVTEGDPAREFKKAGAEVFGGQLVEIPKLTNLSSTKIADHFGVIPTANQPNRFGPNPRWVQLCLDLAASLGGK